MDNAFWVCNWVSNMIYPRYSQMFGALKEVRDSLEQSYFKRQPEIESRAASLYPTDKAEALRILDEYSCQVAEEMLSRWKQLAFYLIVKYNDMAVKPEDEHHNFLRTPEGLGQRVARPGMPLPFARELVKRTGDKYASPAKE